MATIDEDAFTTALALVVDAVVAADFPTARQQLAVAQITLLGLVSDAGAGGSNAKRVMDLKAAKQAVDLAETAADTGRYEIHSTWVI